LSGDQDSSPKSGDPIAGAAPGVEGPRRAGLWRRFLDWVAPSRGGAESATGGPFPPGPITVRLHLPDGGHVDLRGVPLLGEGAERLELRVAPSPENDPGLLLALEALGSVGGPVAEAAPPFPPTPESTSEPAPEAAPASEVREIDLTVEEGADSRTEAKPAPKPLAPALETMVQQYLLEDVLDQQASTVRRGGAALALSEGALDTDEKDEEGGAEERAAAERRAAPTPTQGPGERSPRGEPIDPAKRREPQPTPRMTKSTLQKRSPQEPSASPTESATPSTPKAAVPAKAPSEKTPVPTLLKRQAPIVGIDFGTTFSSVAVCTGGKLTVIPDEEGDVQVPSVVSFPKPGEVLVGKEARERLASEAQSTIASVKRLLGRPYKDPHVANLVGKVAFRTFAGTDKFTRFEAHGQIHSATDLSAMILRKLFENATRFLGMPPSRAVFTVPVGHGTLQRSALEIAARQAGFDPVAMLTEPSASALAYGFRSQRTNCAVYDFGGGTFDFCLLDIDEAAFRVLCAGGDSWLGGDDFDAALGNHLADRFWKETGVDLRTRAVEWQSLLFACERAKRALSSRAQVEINVEDLLHTASGKKGIHATMTRKEFAELVAPLVQKSISLAEGVLGQAGIASDRVANVILSGGTSLVPSVQEAVRAAFKKDPILGDAELSVVKGAALRAAELGGEAVAATALSGRTLREASGRTIGAGQRGGEVVILIQRDDPLPVEASHVFHTLADNQTEMVIVLYEESTASLEQIRSIGQLRYKGLKPAPAGKSHVDFSFLLDEEGLLHATATVEGKKISQTIQLDR
jgi:molecular chaperone DnaK